MAARCAWLFGAGRVIVIDNLDYRLEFVRQFAPAEVYNFDEIGDPVVFLKKQTDSLAPTSASTPSARTPRAIGCTGLLGKKLKLEAGSPSPCTGRSTR
jgi:threonine dehydrogenase-like Zn-dependent dehydrogenase